MTNIDDIPKYHWYTTTDHIDLYDKMYYLKGVTYVAFVTEPEPDILFRYNLKEKGYGDMTMIGG